MNPVEGIWGTAVRIPGCLKEWLNELGAVILASKKGRR